MHYTEIFSTVKVEKNDSFNSYAQSIDCGYMLEPLGEAVQRSTHNLCFGVKIRKIGIPQYIKVGFRVVFFARTCYPDGICQPNY